MLFVNAIIGIQTWEYVQHVFWLRKVGIWVECQRFGRISIRSKEWEWFCRDGKDTWAELRKQSFSLGPTIVTANDINTFMLMRFWNYFRADVVVLLTLFSYPIATLKMGMSYQKEGKTVKRMWRAVSWQWRGLTFSSHAVSSLLLKWPMMSHLFLLIYKMKCLRKMLWRKLWVSMNWFCSSLGKGVLDRRTFRHILIHAVQVTSYYVWQR